MTPVPTPPHAAPAWTPPGPPASETREQLLSADEILWRFHFMLGTIYYSASSPQRIKAFSRGRCDPGDVDATVSHLVPFLAAAFRSAPIVRPATRRPARRPRRRADDVRG